MVSLSALCYLAAQSEVWDLFGVWSVRCYFVVRTLVRGKSAGTGYCCCLSAAAYSLSVPPSHSRLQCDGRPTCGRGSSAVRAHRRTGLFEVALSRLSRVECTLGEPTFIMRVKNVHLNKWRSQSGIGSVVLLSCRIFRFGITFWCTDNVSRSLWDVRFHLIPLSITVWGKNRVFLCWYFIHAWMLSTVSLSTNIKPTGETGTAVN